MKFRLTQSSETHVWGNICARIGLDVGQMFAKKHWVRNLKNFINDLTKKSEMFEFETRSEFENVFYSIWDAEPLFERRRFDTQLSSRCFVWSNAFEPFDIVDKWRIVRESFAKAGRTPFFWRATAEEVVVADWLSFRIETFVRRKSGNVFLIATNSSRGVDNFSSWAKQKNLFGEKNRFAESKSPFGNVERVPLGFLRSSPSNATKVDRNRKESRARLSLRFFPIFRRAKFRFSLRFVRWTKLRFSPKNELNSSFDVGKFSSAGGKFFFRTTNWSTDFLDKKFSNELNESIRLRRAFLFSSRQQSRLKKVKHTFRLVLFFFSFLSREKEKKKRFQHETKEKLFRNVTNRQIFTTFNDKIYLIYSTNRFFFCIEIQLFFFIKKKFFVR